MRGIEAIFAEGKTPPTPKKTLQAEALQVLKEENEEMARELRLLRLRVLAHDKKEAIRARQVRSATEDADILYEAVSSLARVVSNTRREERAVREQVRELLESHQIPPPSTLGSSRSRKNTGVRKTKTTETT